MNPNDFFPGVPRDGQIFIDAFRVRWVYNVEDKHWIRSGVESDVPLARGTQHPDGPTNGLLSARDKAELDKLPEKAGGFGFVLQPGRFLTQENGPENVLTGDVKLVSNSISAQCAVVVDEDCADGGNKLAIQLGLSEAFLDAFCAEIPGKKGPTGDPGRDGRDGRDGTGDGPVGDPGEDGEDATTRDTFTGIKFVESDEVFDTAVAQLNLIPEDGILEVIKAKMNVPDNNTAASKVSASPVIRGVSFPTSNMRPFTLTAPSNDPAPVIDLDLVKLPKGWSESDTPTPVNTVTLSTLVEAVIGFYDAETEKICEQFDTELKEFVTKHDRAARAILHELSSQLAECEFQKPVEFCLGIDASECNPFNKVVGVNKHLDLCPAYTYDSRVQIPDGSPGAGAAGFVRQFNIREALTNGVGTLFVRFTTFGGSDRFIVQGRQGREIFDSGCISTNNAAVPGIESMTSSFQVLEEDNPIVVQVNPNCDFAAAIDAQYQFELSCLT